MKIVSLICIASVALAQPATVKTRSLSSVVTDALDFSVQQSLRMARSLESRPGTLPKTMTARGGLETSTAQSWTCGFFPGTLWYLYEYSGDTTVLRYAREFTARVKGAQYTTTTHDVGFIINGSCGNGYRLTGDTAYRSALRNAARSLSTRFRPFVGCIRSWDPLPWSRQWQYPVIIDNMMNLELLMKAAAEFGDTAFSRIAVSHARTTMRNHFRPDYSSYHVVDYDTVSGAVRAKQTWQGFGDASSWARGQAWGLYGFTMMYRFTRDTAFLHQAQRIASFITRHPRLPEDKIPYWDFDDPGIPVVPRDASAGAIIASTLIELSGYVPATERAEYLTVAETELRTLCSPAYRSAPGANANFIITHGVGNLPKQTEVDVPLSYGDYYFVEALMRMRNVLK